MSADAATAAPPATKRTRIRRRLMAGTLLRRSSGFGVILLRDRRWGEYGPSVRRSTRFLLYGLAGCCSEVVTTGVRSRGRDGNWRLTGTTYLWMLPIYGSAALLFEPAHDLVRRADWPWWRRGALWTAGIFAVEAASGEAIRRFTGEVPWDYTRPRGGKPEP